MHPRSRPHSLGWINRDGKLIIMARGMRAFGQGSIAVLLALYLAELGLSLIQIGFFLSAAVAGSAVFSVVVGLVAEKVGRRRLLVGFSLMFAVAGLGIIFFDDFMPLLLVAFLGGLNGIDSGGPIQPLEQASLPDTVPQSRRTELFALYGIVALLTNSFGALSARLPSFYQKVLGISELDSHKAVFVIFAGFLLLAGVLYALLSPSVEIKGTKPRWMNPLRVPSRRFIFTFTGLVSVDYLAGSLIMQSLLAYWFYTRFGINLDSLAVIFFFAHLLSAGSLWLSAKLANRFGLINVMVFTHLPASLLFFAMIFAPVAWVAVLLWLLRSFFGGMDVPARDSYTMSMVAPEERIAMASVHVVGRNISATIAPSISTVLWQTISAAAPFIVCTCLRITYSTTLFFAFRRARPLAVPGAPGMLTERR